MSNLTFSLLITLFAVSICKLKKTSTQCAALGKPCHLFKWCCSNYVCKDYRCAVKGTKDNQLKWAPEGPKCDWFHHCRKNSECEDNRCVVKVEKVLEELHDKITSK